MYNSNVNNKSRDYEIPGKISNDTMTYSEEVRQSLQNNLERTRSAQKFALASKVDKVCVLLLI